MMPSLSFAATSASCLFSYLWFHHVYGFNVVSRSLSTSPSHFLTLSRRTSVSSWYMFFANEAESSPPTQSTTKQKQLDQTSSTYQCLTPEDARIELVTSNDERFLNQVSSFLIDAFWLNSPHHKLGGGITSVNEKKLSLSDDARMNLLIDQTSDLLEKYGEIMGKRMLPSCVIGAIDIDTKQIVGVVTVKLSLVNIPKESIMEGSDAENMCKSAVANLGPKQRRQYKDASVKNIVKDLIKVNDGHLECIGLLSNLAVSPTSRRRGIAQVLVQEVETLVKDEWGYDKVGLLVESENNNAKSLYEKMGYQIQFVMDDQPAYRVDVEKGEFTQIHVSTICMAKNL